MSLQLPGCNWLQRAASAAAVLIAVFALLPATLASDTSKRLPEGPLEASRAFMNAIQAGKFDAALGMMSARARKVARAEALKQFATLFDMQRLKRQELTSYTQRDAAQGDGFVELFLKLHRDGLQPLAVRMPTAMEGGRWVVHGLFPIDPKAATRQGPPSAEAMVRLTAQSMADFVRSLRARDMTHFRSTTAKVMRDALSVEKYNAGFKGLFPLVDEIAGFQKVPFVAGKPTGLAKNKRLIITGHYATRPRPILVASQYVFDDRAWRLVSLNVKLRAATDKK